ncbi:phage tail terminator protein [Peribacillus tepidiphilus]|uniref:phage tail terminator protein n=1 Tax=Peribacillus tepidiphilus TaxID=2652445 RepID=UPI0012914612|nr:minor capsid protein [Peribacillus tepidiphilus]
MDFIYRLQDYLAKELKQTINVGLLGTNSPSIAIRQTPSSVTSRYVDKGKTFDFSFQVLMKDKAAAGHKNVIDTMNKIVDLLEGLSSDSIKSQNGSFSFIKCECYTLPNFVEKTDHDEYIYTAIFKCELEKGGI